MRRNVFPCPPWIGETDMRLSRIALGLALASAVTASAAFAQGLRQPASQVSFNEYYEPMPAKSPSDAPAPAPAPAPMMGEAPAAPAAAPACDACNQGCKSCGECCREGSCCSCPLKCPDACPM